MKRVRRAEMHSSYSCWLFFLFFLAVLFLKIWFWAPKSRRGILCSCPNWIHSPPRKAYAHIAHAEFLGFGLRGCWNLSGWAGLLLGLFHLDASRLLEKSIAFHQPPDHCKNGGRELIGEKLSWDRKNTESLIWIVNISLVDGERRFLIFFFIN